MWLRRKFGVASKCEICNKLNGKYEWSKKKEKRYIKLRENFWELCTSCHRIYDNTGANSKFGKGYVPWQKGTHIQSNSGKTHIKKGERRGKTTEFKKGQIPWNKGKPWSLEMKKKLSLAHQ